MHVISYAHIRDGVLYHGTLSDLDGTPKATWSYEKGGKKVTHDQPIDMPTFRSMWNRVGKLEVFQRNRVRDPERPVDPNADHVIMIAFGQSDQPQTVNFAIPAGETDPQFLSWLKSLNVPKGSMTPEPPALPKRRRQEDEPRDDFAATREKVYVKFFGDRFKVDRGEAGDGPAIDVYVFKPGENARGVERDFYTLVTGGMSDRRMRVPDSVKHQRAELVLYSDKPTDEQIGMLRWLAGLPHVQKRTWYAQGTTMTNGQPPRPIFEDSDLDCFLFLESIVDRDSDMRKKLEVDGDSTDLLWVVPITEAECQFILDESLNEFLDILDEKGHTHTLDEGRRSFVKSRR
jgi:hypothetical protein